MFRMPLTLLLVAVLAAAFPVFAQQVDPAAFQRVIDENLDLRRQQERLARDFDEVRRQNAKLVLDVQDLERKRDQLTALAAQLKTPEDTRNDLARLESEKQVLIREVDRLNRALADLKATPTPATPVLAPAPGSDLFRKLEQENASLRQELLEAQGGLRVETAAGKSLKQRIQELEADVRKRSEEMTKARKDIERLGKVADAFKKAAEKLARRAYQQEKELKDLKDKAVAGPAGKETGAGKPVTIVRDQTAGSLLGLAEKALRANKPETAEKLYLEALSREPRNPRIHYNLGVVYGDYLNEPAKAVRYYRKYLDLAPDAGDADAVSAWIVDLESRL